MKSLTGSMINAFLLLMLCIVLQGGLPQPTAGMTGGNGDIELPGTQTEGEDTNATADDDATLDHQLRSSSSDVFWTFNATDHLNYQPVHKDVASPPPKG